MRVRGRANIALLLIGLLWPVESVAALDMAELYLRKIRQGERTFYQAGGWHNWRNRLDFFYEADYIFGAGTGDPRFVQPMTSGDPMASTSLGGVVLLSNRRSAYRLTFYSMLSTTAEVDLDTPIFYSIPLFSWMAPAAFAKERGLSLTQHVTGMQFRFQDWVELSYGLLMDERFGSSVYRSFMEANLPIIYLKGNMVAAPGGDRVERVQANIFYDEATWVRSLEAGLLTTEVNEKRDFLYARFDQLIGWFAGEVRVTSDFDFAYANLGLHVSKHNPGDYRAGGKFGFAWDILAVGSVANPRTANMWASGYGTDELQYGVKVEAYLQMPGLNWLAILLMLLGGQTASQHDSYTAENVIAATAEGATALMNAASEDDTVYGGLTLGFRYNDPETLREVPGAAGHVHFYLKYRLFY